MSVTTTTRPGIGRRSTAVLTPITDVIKASVRNGSGHRRETIAATSECGAWTYERDETPGTPWTVTHVPTQLTQAFGNLDAARRWTASGRAVPFLAALAGDKLRAATTTGQTRAANRALAVLANQVIPFTPALVIDHRCNCGGYLTTLASGRLYHVDTCNVDGCAAGCEEHHEVCAQPRAAACDHGACTRRASAHAPACLLDYDRCCGCCNGAE